MNTRGQGRGGDWDLAKGVQSLAGGVKRPLRWLLLPALAIGAGLLIWLQPERQATPDGSSLALESFLTDSDAGFVEAEGDWRFDFPRDHGGHPHYRSEIWYLTGYLQDAAGHGFGFQLAFFRLRLRPSAPERASAWATNQILRAHFALTDRTRNRFHAEERFSRVALGLSGMDESPVRVWLEDWFLEALAAKDGTSFRIRAGDGEQRLELDLQVIKPPLLQGAADLLESGPSGNAFHFYLISRLSATGTLGLGTTGRKVRGEAWLDRAWGAVPISQGQLALNRFALQLGDGRDLLCLQLRRRDGSGTPIPSCLLIGADGSVKSFRRREIRLEPLVHWRSKLDGTSYPLRWRLELPAQGLSLEIEPILEAQELDLATRAWSGTVEVSGRSRGQPVSGRGHLELGGYETIHGPGGS